MVRFFSTVVAGVLLVLPLRALGDEPQSEVTLDELSIEIPNAESMEATAGGVRLEAELAARKATTGDTADLLQGLPGVSLNGAGNISSLPSIHGLADDRLRIEVNGVDPMTACPNHMNSPLSYSDPALVESVTVFSGVTPVSVGGDSIGGSIRVESAPPAFASPSKGFLASGTAGGFFRSNGHALGYHLRTTMALTWLNVTFSQSDSRSNDLAAAKSFKPIALGREGGSLIPGKTIGSSRHDGALRRSLQLSLKREGHLVEIEASQQKVDFEGFPNQRMDMTGNDNRLFTLRYSGSFAWGDLESRLSYQDTRHEMDMGSERYSYGTGMPMDTKAKTVEAALKANVAFSAGHLLRAGAEYLQYTLYDSWRPVSGAMGPNTFWNIDFGERRRVDAFAEWEARWGSEWLTLAGVRSDTVMSNAGPVQGYDDALPMWGADAAGFNASARHRTDYNWDATTLARFMPTTNQTYEVGVGRAVRSPNLYQRYAWSTNAMAALMNNLVGDGNGYIGNLALRPEVAYTASATVDWHDAAWARWRLRATAHFSYIHDYIDARRCDFGQCSSENLTARNSFVLLQYTNQRARIYGSDLSARLPLAESPDWGALAADSTLSVVRGDNLSTGDGLYDIAPLSGVLALLYRLETWTMTAELRGAASKRRVSEARNEIPTAAYFVLNLRSSYAWRFLQIDAGVDNVLNRLYDNPLGGAYLGQGPSMSTTGIPWGVAVPGAARSFHVALKLRFDA